MEVLYDTATECHLPYGITHCYLLPYTSLNPAIQAGTRFTYPGEMEGWVDLVDLIAPRPGVEPGTFRSRVQRSTTAPPGQSGEACSSSTELMPHTSRFGNNTSVELHGGQQINGLNDVPPYPAWSMACRCSRAVFAWWQCCWCWCVDSAHDSIRRLSSPTAHWRSRLLRTRAKLF